jgi:hypothetical protein
MLGVNVRCLWAGVWQAAGGWVAITEGKGGHGRPGAFLDACQRRVPTRRASLPAAARPPRCRMELIKPAVDWRKAGVKVNTMGAAVAAKA